MEGRGSRRVCKVWAPSTELWPSVLCRAVAARACHYLSHQVSSNLGGMSGSDWLPSCGARTAKLMTSPRTNGGPWRLITPSQAYGNPGSRTCGGRGGWSSWVPTPGGRSTSRAPSGEAARAAPASPQGEHAEMEAEDEEEEEERKRLREKLQHLDSAIAAIKAPAEYGRDLKTLLAAKLGEQEDVGRQLAALKPVHLRIRIATDKLTRAERRREELTKEKAALVTLTEAKQKDIDEKAAELSGIRADLQSLIGRRTNADRRSESGNYSNSSRGEAHTGGNADAANSTTCSRQPRVVVALV